MNANLVTTLETSNALKDLGVNIKSMFYWSNYYYSYDPYQGGWESNAYGKLELTYDLPPHSEQEHPKDLVFYSAFTAGELGEMLPARLRMEDHDRWLYTSPLKDNSAWDIRYKAWIHLDNQAPWQKTTNWIQAKTEAEARALMLIYLIKNKLMELPK